MENERRWYDQDPLLHEAMELLSLSSDEEKDQAADFIMKLKEQVAAEVIERVYESVSKYFMKGNRWYDKDPVMIKAIELLRVAPSHIQIAAAKKLLTALSRGEMGELAKEMKEEETNS